MTRAIAILHGLTAGTFDEPERHEVRLLRGHRLGGRLDPAHRERDRAGTEGTVPVEDQEPADIGSAIPEAEHLHHLPTRFKVSLATTATWCARRAATSLTTQAVRARVQGKPSVQAPSCPRETQEAQ